MFRRFLAVVIAIFICPQKPVLAGQQPVTADQIIARYLEAIGAERLSSITSLVERGEVQNILTNPNIANLGRLSPSGGGIPPHLSFERYFKSPNLRYSSSIAGDNVVVSLHGCDGKVAWYIDATLQHKEFKPKP